MEHHILGEKTQVPYSIIVTMWLMLQYQNLSAAVRPTRVPITCMTWETMFMSGLRIGIQRILTGHNLLFLMAQLGDMPGWYVRAVEAGNSTGRILPETILAFVVP